MQQWDQRTIETTGGNGPALVVLRNALAAEVLACLMDDGATMTEEQAVALALNVSQ